MEPLTMTSAQFQKIREQLGLNQQELAQHLGVTQTAISYWETGKRTPRGPVVILLKELAKKVSRKK